VRVGLPGQNARVGAAFLGSTAKKWGLVEQRCNRMAPSRNNGEEALCFVERSLAKNDIMIWCLHFMIYEMTCLYIHHTSNMLPSNNSEPVVVKARARARVEDGWWLVEN
jgi:hypothetical protein